MTFGLTVNDYGGIGCGFACGTAGTDAPEPASWTVLLAAFGIGGLAARRKRAGSPAGHG